MFLSTPDRGSHLSRVRSSRFRRLSKETVWFEGIFVSCKLGESPVGGILTALWACQACCAKSSSSISCKV